MDEERADLDRILAEADVEDSVFALRPDYRALLIATDGIVPGPGDARSEQLLHAAETSARDTLADQAVDQLPHVAAWREAFRSFGAKPQRTRNSLEALLRRAPDGLPRVNRLTDFYNAISVSHQIPLGGEDLAPYIGSPHLVRAGGTEAFETTAHGEPVTEHPEPGEVVWRDDAGVTCRRWNWRQTIRTRLHEGTTAALFILDGLDPLPDDALHAAADDLLTQLAATSPSLRSAVRLIRR